MENNSSQSNTPEVTEHLNGLHGGVIDFDIILNMSRS